MVSPTPHPTRRSYIRSAARWTLAPPLEEPDFLLDAASNAIASYVALASGLSAALTTLGGVQPEHCSGSLSAAFRNLAVPDAENIACRYARPMRDIRRSA